MERSVHQLTVGERKTPGLTVELSHHYRLEHKTEPGVYTEDHVHEATVLVDYDPGVIRIEVRRHEEDPQVEVVLR